MAVGCCMAASSAPGNTISLAGQWRFALDPANAGIGEGWFNKALADTVMLPGSTDTNKKGTPNTRKPDLQHLARLYEYTGAAWYQQDITIPEAWKGRRVVLFLERCHWETQVWLDGKQCGMQDSLIAPHTHELGINLTPGVHTLTVRVDNSMKYDVGGWAHIITEETQTNWNGIIGRIELRATPRTWIESVQVYPDVASGSIRIKTTLHGPPTVVEYAVSLDRQSAVVHMSSESLIVMKVLFPHAWDEFNPHVYTLTASVPGQTYVTTFGLRDLRVKDKRLTLNGRNIFLRGTLECCIFPKTGYPPTDVDSWLRILKIAKSYGLNHMRFHSWCPPEAAFEAADQLGILFHVELPQWAFNVGKDKPRDEFIKLEEQRILDTYGNHPSFGMLCMGNELRGDTDFLQKLVVMGQQYDPRHLYTPATAWSYGENDDYDVGGARGLRGPKTDHDFTAGDADFKVPVITHEVGQWSVFPSMAEISKYTGVTRARNFELIRDTLKEHGLLDQAADFTLASGKLSSELYKEEIEVLLRTRGHGGFQLLDLHDFPGQGTALIGMLDPFWDSKGFIKPEEWRRFCGPIVPLLRMPKRAYTSDEAFVAKAQVAQFGPKDITDTPVWKITTQDGKEIASGTLPERLLRTGDLYDLGTISVPLRDVNAPAKLTVTVSLQWANASNSWDIWVYPAKTDVTPPAGVMVTQSLEDALSGLKSGRKVLLLVKHKDLVNPGTGSFTPVFWSPILFRAGAKKGVGILCDPKHPALAEFPTDFYTDWQWYDLLEGSWNMDLTATPAGLKPVVQVIDNFIKDRKLGNLVEARVGEGRLMVCSMNISGDLAARPAARQMLKSIQDYMGSPAFQPAQVLTFADLATFLGNSGKTVLQSLGAVVAKADSQERDFAASNAIDGDPDSIWHTAYTNVSAPYPHEIQVDMQKPVELTGFKCLPRQDMQNGWFTDYAFYVSEDGKNWGAPVAKGSFAADESEKTVKFDKPCKGRFIRLVALKGLSGNPWAAIAELDVIPTPAK